MKHKTHPNWFCNTGYPVLRPAAKGNPAIRQAQKTTRYCINFNNI